MVKPREILRPLMLKLELLQIQVLVALAVYIIFFTGQFSAEALRWLVIDAAIVSPGLAIVAIALRSRRIHAMCASLDTPGDKEALKIKALNHAAVEALSVFFRWTLGGGTALCLLAFQVSLSKYNITAFWIAVFTVLPLSVVYSYLVTENSMAPLLRVPAIAGTAASDKEVFAFSLALRTLSVVGAIAAIPLLVLGSLLYLQSSGLIQIANLVYHIGFLTLLTAAATAMCLRELTVSTRRNVSAISHALQAIKQGNLLERPAPRLGTAELGGLCEHLNSVRDQVKGVIAEIQKASSETVRVAERLAEASQTLSAGTEEMSQQTNSIAGSSTRLGENLEIVSSSVEEMSIAVQDIARRSAEAASAADNANKMADHAQSIVQALGANAKEIGKVIETIADIADQTNLLSLNAAIEAADAGSFGNRFAVVAAEVKDLARQTAESSADIRDRIESIQNSSGQTVRAIDSINQAIQNVNQANSAVASFVEEQSITSRDIAANTMRAAAASGEMARNVNNVATVVTQGAEEASTMAQLAERLSGTAQHLGETVAQFKT